MKIMYLSPWQASPLILLRPHIWYDAFISISWLSYVNLQLVFGCPLIIVLSKIGLEYSYSKSNKLQNKNQKLLKNFKKLRVSVFPQPTSSKSLPFKSISIMSEEYGRQIGLIHSENKNLLFSFN